jgi:hypothetical protein
MPKHVSPRTSWRQDVGALHANFVQVLPSQELGEHTRQIENYVPVQNAGGLAPGKGVEDVRVPNKSCFGRVHEEVTVLARGQIRYLGIVGSWDFRIYLGLEDFWKI